MNFVLGFITYSKNDFKLKYLNIKNYNTQKKRFKQQLLRMNLSNYKYIHNRSKFDKIRLPTEFFQSFRHV